MADLFLSNKALTQAYASPETQEIIRRTNETSPVVRQEAGFYENPLQTIFKYVTIPQQILYTFGKNLGEEAFQREIDPNSSFFDEISNAIQGKGNVSFNKVLKAYNLESIDKALPEEFRIDSLVGRLPFAVLAGLASGFASANPIIGITAAFATNSFLSGQGVATSVADVVLDPLNKLRIFGQTAKGLGVTNDVHKQLIKAGRLEDLVSNGIVRVAKPGAKKAADDLYEVVVSGVEEGTLNSLVTNGRITKLQDGVYSVIATGAKELEQLKGAAKVRKFSRIVRKGEFAEDALQTIVAEPTSLSVIGQLLNGDRKLFDFKGNSGFVINDTNPFLGKLLVNSPYRSVDILTPIALPAQVLDYGIDGFGTLLSKVPGFDTIKKLEADLLSPITAKVNSFRKTILSPVLSGGVDAGLKFRKMMEGNLKSKSKEVVLKAKLDLAKFTPKGIDNVTQQLNFVEKQLVELFNTGQQRSATKIQEVAFAKDNYIKTLKNQVTDAINDTGKLGDVLDAEGLKVAAAVDERFLNVTPEDLARAPEVGSPEWAQQADNMFEAIEATRLKNESINEWIVTNKLREELLAQETAQQIKDTLIRQGKAFEEKFGTSIPTSKLLDIQEGTKDLAQGFELNDVGQQWQLFTGKLDIAAKQLASEKEALLKQKKNIEALKIINTELSDVDNLGDLKKALIKKLGKDKVDDVEDLLLNNEKLNNLKKLETELIENFDNLKKDSASVALMGDALFSSLKIKGMDDVSRMFAISDPEIDIIKKGMELLGFNTKDKIKFLFTNTEFLGKVGLTDGVVADLIQTAGVKDTSQMVLRISNMTDVRDVAGLLGQYLLKVLPKNQLDEMLNIVRKEGDQGADTTNRFMQLFTDVFLNPKGLLLEKEAADVSRFGKVMDGFRQFLDYIKGMLFRKKFKSDDVKGSLEKFIRGTDKEALDGAELFRLKTVVDENTGKLLDPQHIRENLNATFAELKQAGLVAPGGGITVGKDGFAYQPMLVKETDPAKMFKTAQKIAAIDIANKGHVGIRVYNTYQRLLKPHDPEAGFFNPVYEQVVIKDGVISENMAKEFQTLTDFSANASAHKVATAIVNRVSAAYGMILKSDFENDLGLLLSSQATVLKSKEAIPAIEYMTKFLAFGDVAKTAKWEANNAKNIFNRYNLAGDNTALDNNFYGDVMTEINFFLKNQPTSELTGKVREIKKQLTKNTTVSQKEFQRLNENITTLSNEGVEGALKKHLSSYTNSFLEQTAKDLDTIKSSADQHLTPKVAERFKKAMDSRYENLANPSLDGSLGKSVSAVINKNLDELDGFSTISQAMERSRIATFDKDFRRNNVSLVSNADRTFSEIKEYSIFKAPKNNPNPIARALDGTYFPKSLQGAINMNPKVPYEQMSQLGKLLDNLLSGISKKTATDITENTPFLNKLGVTAKAKLQSTLMSANYDYVLNLFKGHALLSPAFHARNAISAFFVNSSHGVDPTDTMKGMEAALYSRGLHPQFRGKSFDKSKFTIDKTGQVTFTDATLTAKETEFIELLARSEKGGVLASGRLQEIVGDGGQTTTQKVDGGSLNPFSMDFVLLKANNEAAGLIEDAVRMGSMKHAQGVLQYGIEDAANFTKLLHFDYNVLTNAEKGVMKRLIPFYTYTRKALSRDSRMFAERTGEVYALGRMVAAMQSGSEPERTEAVSSFIRDQLGVDVHVDDNGRHSYLLLGGLIPAADFVGLAGKVTEAGILEPSEALKELLMAFMRNSAPLIKGTAESAFDYNFYFNKPIKQVEGDLADTFGVAIPSNIAAMLQSVRMIRDMDKIFHAAFNLKNVTRPDLPNPSELEMGRSRALLKAIGGVAILDNSKPEDNYFFNRILPTKKAFQEADSNIRRAARKGFLPNILNRVEQKSILQQKHTERTINEQESFERLNFLAPKDPQNK